MITFDSLMTLFVAVIASQGLWSLILYKVQQKDKHRDLSKKADLVLLRDALVRNCEAAMARTYTTTAEIEDVERLYDVYKAYEGNGLVEELYGEFKKLPKHPSIIRSQDILSKI